MQIKFTLDKGAYKPEKAHEADAGYDLRAMKDEVLCSFRKGGAVFDTGVHIEIPRGYKGEVTGRSGLNIMRDIICPKGTIDSGFTGSIRVKLYNLGCEDYKVHAGDKIAQLIIVPIADCELIETESLEETERGSKGFGSTGR